MMIDGSPTDEELEIQARRSFDRRVSTLVAADGLDSNARAVEALITTNQHLLALVDRLVGFLEPKRPN